MFNLKKARAACFHVWHWIIQFWHVAPYLPHTHTSRIFIEQEISFLQTKEGSQKNVAPRGWFATFCVELHWYFHISKIRGANSQNWISDWAPWTILSWGFLKAPFCQGASVKFSRCNMAVAPASLQLHPWAAATRKKHHLVLVSCPVSMGPSPWLMIFPIQTLESNIGFSSFHRFHLFNISTSVDWFIWASTSWIAQRHGLATLRCTSRR